MCEASSSFNVDRAGAASEAMEGAENYFRWQRAVMASHLGRRVLEIGSGAGGFTEVLLDREAVTSVDIDDAMLERLKSRFADRSNWTGLRADLSGPDFAERVAPYRCDSVTALNVIEHIEDDVAALTRVRSVLPAGGTAAILVPAHQWLYGAFDAAVGHYRRYTRDELAGKLERAGFRVDRSLYFNAIGALGWWWNYRLMRVARVNRGTAVQVGLFDRWIVPVARTLESRIRPPFGISAICLATAT